MPGDGGRRPLPGYGRTAARVTTASGRVVALCLLVAATKALQDQGLMGVTDRTLGGYDGMLFPFAEPTVTEFWMRDTPQPLSIAFFDAGGRYVSSTDMAPCGSGTDCPTYAARSAYRTAVEVPRGRLDALGLGAGSTLRRVPGACPARPSPDPGRDGRRSSAGRARRTGVRSWAGGAARRRSRCSRCGGPPVGRASAAR